ncbi:MAG TPA: cytochrome C [Burkholderiaceae bacterium]|nr:cytochrome C [Burkholderiaceae bacterium]
MPRWPLILLSLGALPWVAAAQPEANSRGALLYATHCGACHDRQVHWRRQRLVTDWPSLVAQVQRWQATAQLGWSDDDVQEVARHLDATVYRLAQPTAAAGAGLTR